MNTNIKLLYTLVLKEVRGVSSDRFKNGEVHIDLYDSDRCIDVLILKPIMKEDNERDN